ncbi:MAG: hypothetical protein ACHQ5A_13060 [Opitutales bacterium]
MPTYRSTNSGLQTKGTLWAGFDPLVSAIIAGVFMVSVMLTFGTISVLHLSWMLVVPVFFLLPNFLLLGVVFFLIMGKPPRYLPDWADSRILGRTAVHLGDIREPEPFDTD